MELAVSVLMKESFHLGGSFVPSFFKGALTNMLGDGYVRSIQFTVAHNPNIRNCRNLFTYQLKDGTSKITCNSFVGFCLFESVSKERMVKSLSARREAIDVT